jgi:hypothetical protein
MITPIFTGPAGVGVGVAEEIAVGVAVCVGVGVSVGPTVTVHVGERVGVSNCFAPPPHAASTGTIKTKARARAMNLHHKVLFGHMVNHLCYHIAKQ